MANARVIDRASFRRGSVLAVLALCLAFLTGCSGGGFKPFAKSDGTPGPSGKTVPPIALVEAAGLPPAKLPPLRDALAIAAGKRDMAIIDNVLDTTTFTLRGNFRIAADPGGVRVNYDWTLADPAGTVLHTVAAEEVAPGAPKGDPWLQVTPAVLQRIAAYTTESLSSRLSQLGYATEVGGLPPPIETYARAGPDADKDIDYETLHGPGAVPPKVADAKKPRRKVKPVAEPANEEMAAAPPKAKGGKQITAVAVVAVKGSPGSGNADLTTAMRRTLADAGWPVLAKPRHDALTIAGEVKLGPKGKNQNVALAWTVKTPDGKTLGTVRQSNAVPPGSLDKGWGDSALLATQAAAGGIYDLVKKYR